MGRRIRNGSRVRNGLAICISADPGAAARLAAPGRRDDSQCLRSVAHTVRHHAAADVRRARSLAGRETRTGADREPLQQPESVESVIVRAILITGGTGELGHAVVGALSAHYRCIILYREQKAWEELRKSIRGDNITGISDPSRVTDPIYGVLHLAGAFTMGSSLDDFQRLLDACLFSAVRAI